jgi:ABC-type branched-subunit amino acid transport system substrate-binding protein
MVMAKKLPKGGGKGAKGMNLYTPVKQSTIDNIKKMGMSAALKKAGSSKNAEFVQGVKRMYGADRLKKAMAASKPVAKSPDAARAMAAGKSVKNAKRNQPAAKSADAARDKYLGTGSNRVNITKNKVNTSTKKYTSKSPKPMNPKGLFPGLLGGKK